MNVSVFDTYVKRSDGRTMHFDILVPDTENDLNKIYEYGRRYLATKGEELQPLAARECRFCHVEPASVKAMQDIDTQGFHIIEMENC
jgi:hypothetical protein